MTTPAFSFRQMAGEAHDGLLLKPLIGNYLHDAQWPGFSLWFPPQRKGGRKPDGYFHPSTHPMMTERQLYYYLDASPKLDVEPLEYMGTLSVTMGTAFHGFMQFCLGPKNAGLLVPPPAGSCPVCGLPTAQMPAKGKCWEHGVVDEATRSRGHMDGMVNIPGFGMAGWEFKTSNTMKLAKLVDNDLETYREKWPAYYAQNQDYMRITGLAYVIVTFIGMGYPWSLVEVKVPRDHAYINDLNTKYSRVLAYRASNEPPPPCCAPGSKDAKACFARRVCPVGLM